LLDVFHCWLMFRRYWAVLSMVSVVGQGCYWASGCWLSGRFYYNALLKGSMQRPTVEGRKGLPKVRVFSSCVLYYFVTNPRGTRQPCYSWRKLNIFPVAGFSQLDYCPEPISPNKFLKNFVLKGLSLRSGPAETLKKGGHPF